ncbi:hypothetical protein RSOL_380130 [Rhizoctonia solani AG-3 Rhs1AP]|uniref:Uncharacterized protein n=2 Tax=Rhizoctonia solani AG-3 TaxID=1086053 RepID=A0A074RNF7_9AGAM|nr:hypothetical protein RSOL_380130 [Rhizoctonia solani AG-3 Rhs1AP]KEP46870.1 hypothetical protein V565_177780 [Rhizoctonia solani 123E]
MKQMGCAKQPIDLGERSCPMMWSYRVATILPRPPDAQNTGSLWVARGSATRASGVRKWSDRDRNACKSRTMKATPRTTRMHTTTTYLNSACPSPTNLTCPRTLRLSKSPPYHSQTETQSQKP